MLRRCRRGGGSVGITPPPPRSNVYALVRHPHTAVPDAFGHTAGTTRHSPASTGGGRIGTGGIPGDGSTTDGGGVTIGSGVITGHGRAAGATTTGGGTGVGATTGGTGGTGGSGIGVMTG